MTCLMTKFSKQILFFSLLAFGSASLSAQKCQYERNEIDGITNLAVKITIPEVLCRLNNQPLYIKAQCIGVMKYLKIRYYRNSDFYIVDNKEIAFTLSNNEVVTLTPRTMPVDSSNTDGFVTVSSLLVYKLDPDQFQKLVSNPITKFKYYLSSGFVEEDIKGSRQNRIMEILRCVE